MPASGRRCAGLQLRSLYRKLDATRREEVLSVAYAHGLLEHAAALRSVMR